MKKKLITLLVILIAPFSILATETNHLIISEFSFDTSTAPDGAIIEIYNPTSSDIDVSSYRIERDSGGNGNPGDLIYLNNSGKDGFIRTTNIIKSHGYFLIVDREIAALTNIGDFIKTNNISINAGDSIALGTGAIDGPSDPDCVDWLGYGSATLVEGNGPAPDPSYPGSIERKAWSGATSNSMTIGADTNHGNAEDSNNNNLDFIIRPNADWQNTSSPTEIPYSSSEDTNAPVFNENSILFSINKKVVKLWWSPAVDAENSSPIYYDIFVSDTSHTYNFNYSTTNTSYSLSLDSGTHYIMIQARDSTSNSTTYTREITVTIKGLSSLDNVYFFPNPLKNDEHIHFNNFTDTAEIYIYTIQGHLLFKTTNTNFAMPPDVAAGVYYVVIKDGKQKKIKKLVYIK